MPATLDALLIVALVLTPGFIFTQIARKSIAYVAESTDARFYLMIISSGIVIHAIVFLWTSRIIDYQLTKTLPANRREVFAWAVVTTLVLPMGLGIIVGLLSKVRWIDVALVLQLRSYREVGILVLKGRRARMTATIDQQTVQGWGAELARLHARLKAHFGRAESRRRVRRYIEGLLGPVERKNGWQLAEQAGEATPYGMQRLLAGAKWDAEAVRDDLRAYVMEHLADPAAVLIIDETGFLKKGVKSVGVQRQYSGTAGRVENCQIGVFLAYATPQGRTFLDRALYLPQGWADDPARRAEAGVPADTTFQTKPELARGMLERALDAGVPAAWVAGDEVYGHNRALRRWLEGRRQPFVLAVPANEALVAAGTHGPQAGTAAALIAAVPPGRWARLSAGDGSKGPRVYDWARVPLARPDVPDWGHWLLARRSLTDPEDLAYSVVGGPADAPLALLARVAGRRWAVEESLEIAKGEVGLDHYEVRRWDGWYRHITLALCAQAFLTVVRAQTDATPAQKGGARPCSPPR